MQEDTSAINTDLINVKEGLQILNNNAALYTKLLGSFISNGMYEAFIAALETKDTKIAEEKIHAFKGVAANLRLTLVYKLSEQMDSGLKNGELPSEESLKTLETAYNNTVEIIKKVIADPSSLSR